MGICPHELRQYVIRPTLKYLGDYSQNAEVLLMATAAVESNLGSHLKEKFHQGLGVFRISPRSHSQVWDGYLALRPDLASRVRGLASQQEFLAQPHQELTTNLSYATAIAWMMYKRKNKIIPDHCDHEAIARFWRRNFHKRPNVSVQQFVAHVSNLITQSQSAA